MSAVNICLGAFIERNGEDITDKLLAGIRKDLAPFVEIGKFDIFRSRDQITNAIKGNQYDYVIAQENIHEESIGAGSIKGWKSLNPRVRVILIISSKKAGGRKLESLYEAANYYDAIYDVDLSGKNIAALFNKSRSKKEALEYYKIRRETVEEDSHPPKMDAAEFDKAMEEMERLYANRKEEAIVEEQSEANPPDNKETSAFVEETIFDDYNGRIIEERVQEVLNTDVMGEGLTDRQTVPEETIVGTMKDSVPEDLEMHRLIMEEYERNDAQTAEDTFPDERPSKDKEEKNQRDKTPHYGLMSIHRPNSGVIRTKGIVLDVIDSQIMMLGLGEKIELTDTANHSVLLLIQTAEKGYVDGGRYHASNKSYKAFINCFINEETVVLEVPNIDLLEVEEEILGKSVNIIISKL